VERACRPRNVARGPRRGVHDVAANDGEGPGFVVACLACDEPRDTVRRRRGPARRQDELLRCRCESHESAGNPSAGRKSGESTVSCKDRGRHVTIGIGWFAAKVVSPSRSRSLYGTRDVSAARETAVMKRGYQWPSTFRAQSGQNRGRDDV